MLVSFDGDVRLGHYDLQKNFVRCKTSDFSEYDTIRYDTVDLRALKS